MNRLPSIKQLQYLLALYEHGHFGRAAEACFIGQSTLSAAISNLEDTLDAQLLERDHKTFIFTAIGEEIVQQSRFIIEQCMELTDYAQSEGQPMKGQLRLGCIPTIAPFILSELMLLSKARYPDLQLLIKEETTDLILQSLTEGHLDLAILALPYEADNLHTRVLARDPFKLVLHRDWSDKGFEKDLHHWPDQSIFLLEKEHCLTKHALEACELKERRKIHPFFATSLHTLTQMVNNKLGVSFLPQMAINSGILSGTDLIQMKPGAESAYRKIGIAWRKTSTRQQSYRLMGDMIQEILSGKCRES